MAVVRTQNAVRKPFASTLAISVWSLALLGVPSGASATDFSISGLLEQYCCSWPNGGAPSFIPTKTNNLVKLNDFPFAGGGGGMTIRQGLAQPVGPYAGVTGSPAGKIVIPEGAIRGVGSFLDTTPGFPGWISIFTAVNFKNEAGTMTAGGQTGTASYCANYAGNPNCTDPASGTYAAGPFHGRLSYTAGGNNYGGTMRLLGGTPGFLRRTDGGPSKIRLGYFAAPLNQIGGPFSEYGPETNTAFFWPATLPATNTTSATSTSVQQLLFAGIPWGTGVVYAGRTGGTGAVPTQSISEAGTDTRTSTSGFGNISLVAASISGTNASNTFPILIKLSLAVPEPGTTSMLVCGMGLLGVFAVRRGRRRTQA